MQQLNWPSIKRVLCLGAHADDIEIGCGGTLLRLLEDQPGLSVLWVVATGNEVRQREARRSAERFLHRAEHFDVHLWGLQDGYLPYLGRAVKDAFFELRTAFTPDLIFTHRLEDRHQDHRLLAELTWNTFRDHLILEYEIPKYEGDLAQPNLLVPLSPSICEQKIELLLECFPSQTEKPWFQADTFRALHVLRGLEANADSGLAEAFTARKLCW